MKNKTYQNRPGTESGFWRYALAVVVVGLLTLTAAVIWSQIKNMPKSVFSGRIVLQGLSEAEPILDGNFEKRLKASDYADLRAQAEAVAKTGWGDKQLLDLSVKVATHLAKTANLFAKSNFDSRIFWNEEKLSIPELRLEFYATKAAVNDYTNREPNQKSAAIMLQFLGVEDRIWKFWSSPLDNSGVKECIELANPTNAAMSQLSLARAEKLCMDYDESVNKLDESIDQFVIVVDQTSIKKDLLTPLKATLAGLAENGNPASPYDAIKQRIKAQQWSGAIKAITMYRHSVLPDNAAALEVEGNVVETMLLSSDWIGLDAFRDLLQPRVQLMRGVAQFGRRVENAAFIPDLVSFTNTLDFTHEEKDALDWLRIFAANFRAAANVEAAVSNYYGGPGGMNDQIKDLANQWQQLAALPSEPSPLRGLPELVKLRADNYQQLIAGDAQMDAKAINPFIDRIRESVKTPAQPPINQTHYRALYRLALWARRQTANVSDAPGIYAKDAGLAGDPSETEWSQWMENLIQAHSDWVNADSYDTVWRLRNSWTHTPGGNWSAPPSPLATENINRIQKLYLGFEAADLKGKPAGRAEVQGWIGALTTYLQWRDNNTDLTSPQKWIAATPAAEVLKNWRGRTQAADNYLDLFVKYSAGADPLLKQEARVLQESANAQTNVSRNVADLLDQWTQLIVDVNTPSVFKDHAVKLRQLLRSYDVVDGISSGDGRSGTIPLTGLIAYAEKGQRASAANGDDSLARFYAVFRGAAANYLTLRQMQSQVFGPIAVDVMAAPSPGAEWFAALGGDTIRWQNLRRDPAGNCSQIEHYQTAAKWLWKCRDLGPNFERGQRIGGIILPSSIPASAWTGDVGSWEASLREVLVEQLSCAGELVPEWNAMNSELAAIVEARNALITAKKKSEHLAVRDMFEKIHRGAVTSVGAYLAKIELQRLGYLLTDHTYYLPGVPWKDSALQETFWHTPDWAYVTMSRIAEENLDKDDFEFPSFVAPNGRRYRALGECQWEVVKKGTLYDDSRISRARVKATVRFTFSLDDSLPDFAIVKADGSTTGKFSSSANTFKDAWNLIFDPSWLQTNRLVASVSSYTRDQLLNHSVDLRDTQNVKDGSNVDRIIYYWRAPNSRDALPQLATIAGVRGPENLGFPYPWPQSMTRLTIPNTPKPPMNCVHLEKLMDNAENLIKGSGALGLPSDLLN